MPAVLGTPLISTPGSTRVDLCHPAATTASQRLEDRAVFPGNRQFDLFECRLRLIYEDPTLVRKLWRALARHTWFRRRTRSARGHVSFQVATDSAHAALQ